LEVKIAAKKLVLIVETTTIFISDSWRVRENA